MISRVKNAFNDLLVRNQNLTQGKSVGSNHNGGQYGRLTSKIEYTRPLFLTLSDEDIATNTSRNRKPISPKCVSCLPFASGYCEIINAGKSSLNEDCSMALTITLTSSENSIDGVCQDVSNDQQKSENSSDKSTQLLIDKESTSIVGTDEAIKDLGVDCSDENITTSKEPHENGVSEIKKKQKGVSEKDEEGKNLRFDYFAIFDGHAGPGAALYAANMVHQLLTERFKRVLHLLTNKKSDIPPYLSEPHVPQGEFQATKLPVESLVTGIIQEVVVEIDKHLAVDSKNWGFKGGCTVLIVVFVVGKMYVASAGDCRAVLCRTVPQTEKQDCQKTSTLSTTAMSQDFTPQTERRRLQYLAYIQPSLLSTFFTRLEFVKRIIPNDVGKQVLYRDYHMTGWAYKTITEADLKAPMIQGNGKATRLLGTIGVTRGLGDYTVIALNMLEDVPIKPFMSSIPEVRVYNLTSSEQHHHNDVLIMGSDGLWDVVSNERASQIVTDCLQNIDKNDPSRFTQAAVKLAETARGEPAEGHLWRMADGRPGSMDDITVFVIPMQKAAMVHCDVT